MRILGFVFLLAALSGHAFALETSAGADTVNTTQVGINAKIDAGNAITGASINQILNCQKAGKLYDATTSTCIAVDEPLAKKIAACTTAKQFYNQNTGVCVASAPDLTSQLNTTNTSLANATNLINAFVSCANSKMLYSTATGGCVASGGAATSVVQACQWAVGGSSPCSPQCPAGYSVSGCSAGNGKIGYMTVQPSGNGCYCNGNHGSGGWATCYAYCVK